MKGLGHAILKAKSFVGNEPFAVLFGDGAIVGEKPAIGQLIEHYGEFGKGVVGVKKLMQKTFINTVHLKLSIFTTMYLNAQI